LAVAELEPWGPKLFRNIGAESLRGKIWSRPKASPKPRNAQVSHGPVAGAFTLALPSGM